MKWKKGERNKDPIGSSGMDGWNKSHQENACNNTTSNPLSPPTEGMAGYRFNLWDKLSNGNQQNCSIEVTE